MSNLWFRDYSLEEVNAIFAKYMTGFLEIQATQIESNLLVAQMPVSDRVKQPFGLLHGGASVVLAESVGSVASNMIIDNTLFAGVGMEVNANHLHPVNSGIVSAYCSPLHIGRTSHVWDIRIKDEQQQTVCVSRLTVAIVKKNDNI
ncbi:MAG: hotdog fold thioesterase [Sphingobacterium sp.]|uniref:hotdog fold thioesterase n=1 Tax=Sphingobacterium sp. JB170 TaxID=1434842 RepID=UPI00097E86C5|nr:hotdog fold thioesterase [Sphingobacterium sp. JB170]SJN44447.1 ComA operon protein 2 [Sphingobacterium sp. JB170]